MGAQNQSVHQIETKLKTMTFAFHYLNRTSSFHFHCVSIKSFYNVAFVVCYFNAQKKCASKNNFYTLDVSVCRCSEKHAECMKTFIFPYLHLTFPNCNVSISRDTPRTSQATKINLFAKSESF